MNKIVAVTTAVEANDIILIKRISQAIFKVEPLVCGPEDLYYQGIKPDLILTFGKKAFESINRSYPHIALPEPSRLLDLPENEESRQYAWEKLAEARTMLDAKSKGEQDITPQEILPPKLTRIDISELEKSSPNGWVGRTRSGKSIRLSAGRTQEGSEDIKLTFAELYALKVAMELLEVTEFHLVTSTQNNNRSGS